MNRTQAFPAALGEGAPIRAHLSWQRLLRRTFDPLLAIVAFVAICWIHQEPFDKPHIAVCGLVFALMFIRNPEELHPNLPIFRTILADWALVSGVLLFIGSVTGSIGWIYAPVLLTWFPAVPFLLYISHRLLPLVTSRVIAKHGMRRVVIAGASAPGRKLAMQFAANPMLGMQVLGFFDDRAGERLGAVDEGDVLGRLDDLPAYARSQDVGAIFIALPMASQPRILRLLDELRDTTASIYFVPDIFIYDVIQARIDNIGGMPLVAVCESPNYGVSGLVKRIEDIVISSLFLLLAWPVMLAIAIGVKMSSPGPVIFKQRRYGLDGKEISVYKFRTMRVMEDGAVVQQAQKADPRVTRFGAFLRRTSLDELPQFINVLQGRMSVVGPRPHAVSHNEAYRKLIKGYMLRHKVRPGITGLAQVSGCRGETDTVEKMAARVQYDLKYLRNWSVRLDLAIIARTALVVFGDKQAY